MKFSTSVLCGMSLAFLLLATSVDAEELWSFSLPSLNLRENLDISAKVIAKVPYASKLSILETRKNGNRRWNEWKRVEFQGAAGWVYAAFLSNSPIEPQSDISQLPASELAIKGKWYSLSPFVLGEAKFPHGEVNASSGLTFDQNGKLIVHNYDGNSTGTWNLVGEHISIKSEGAEDQYTGLDISGQIQFYKIREDWLVFEISSSEVVNKVSLPRFYFMMRPLSEKSTKEVQDWVIRETK